MKLTQQQLMQAVRAAGAGRESFTCADVREQLGLSAKDRQKANQFYRAFRALQAEASDEIEKLATNCYRLRPPAPELVEVLLARGPARFDAIEADVIEVERNELIEVTAPLLESAALEGAAVQSAATVPAWRGHMLRLGRRVRSLFGGRASTSREVSLGA
jgi:hypothetical protein